MQNLLNDEIKESLQSNVYNIENNNTMHPFKHENTMINEKYQTIKRLDDMSYWNSEAVQHNLSNLYWNVSKVVQTEKLKEFNKGNRYYS